MNKDYKLTERDLVQVSNHIMDELLKGEREQ